MRLCDLCAYLELNGLVWAEVLFQGRFRVGNRAWWLSIHAWISSLDLSVAWWWYRGVCRKMDEMSVAVLYSLSLGLCFGACVGRVNGNDTYGSQVVGGRSESDVGVGMNHRRGASVS